VIGKLPALIAKRLLGALPTLLAVSIIGFTLMRYHINIGPIDLPAGWGVSAFEHVLPKVHLLDALELKQPIDPLAELKQNPQISREAIAKETERLGLNQPLWEQYRRWVAHWFEVDAQGHWRPNLGKTLAGEDVFEQLTHRASNTLLLNLCVLILTWGIAIPLGIWAALVWRTRTEAILTALASIGMALPGFVLALMLVLVAAQTGWLPVGGLKSPYYDSLSPIAKILDVAWHLVLPTLVLTLGGLASLMRQMRGNLLDILDSEFIRTARAKGLSEWRVVWIHAVRPALNPLVTIFGFEFAALLSGTILVESVLNFPGLGFYTYQAALQADTNVMMSSLLLSSFMLIGGNLIADLLLQWLDPRVAEGLSV
jgi:peptide/nickel transport system permease protein